MKENYDILRINKFKNKDIYSYAVAHNLIGLQDLCLIQNDDEPFIKSVEYDAVNKKLIYTLNNDTNNDIISLAGLKAALNLSDSATTGSYTSLNNLPSINGVILSGNKSTEDLNIKNDYIEAENKPQINGIPLVGNKTTEDLNINIDYNTVTSKPSINNHVLSGNVSAKTLGIQYSDIVNTPNIPSVTSQYSSGDESQALSGKGVSQALQNYVHVSRTVTGDGALNGGGALTGDVKITHKLAPTGLQTSASKIGVDSYGHVQLGGGITAADVNAQPATYSQHTTSTAITGTDSIVFVMASVSEYLGFGTYPKQGQICNMHYINVTPNSITLTIPSIIGIYSNVYFNGSLLQNNIDIVCETHKSKQFEIICMQSTDGNYMIITQK